MATEKEAKKVPFTPEQMEIMQQMLAEARESGNQRKGSDAISIYNARDPKSIESVNVKRIEGKYVLGFKNFQSDSFKKKPQYLIYKADPTRGLYKEPYITLILQENENEEKVEKEMMLVDYMNEREKYQAKCVEVKVKKVIEDHGILGSSGEYAVAVDDKGQPMQRQQILAQTEHEEREFLVELPGFSAPVSFIGDFLA